MLDAEVQRINTTTRAPDMLAEIKTALGDDPVRFANSFAKPILVERLLREKFENDDQLHASQRRAVEMVRRQLLTARSSRGLPRRSSAKVGDEALTPGAEDGSRKAEPESQSLLTSALRSTATEDGSAATNRMIEKLVAILKDSRAGLFTETTWQLAPRPAATNAPGADEIEIRKRFGPNAQILSSPPAAGHEPKFYFEDLPGELQNVLRAQLRRPGDVSAVIETPGGFLLYVAREKTDAVLSVASLSLPRRSYEQWIEEQSKGAP